MLYMNDPFPRRERAYTSTVCARVEENRRFNGDLGPTRATLPSHYREKENIFTGLRAWTEAGRARTPWLRPAGEGARAGHCVYVFPGMPSTMAPSVTSPVILAPESGLAAGLS